MLPRDVETGSQSVVPGCVVEDSWMLGPLSRMQEKRCSLEYWWVMAPLGLIQRCRFCTLVSLGTSLAAWTPTLMLMEWLWAASQSPWTKGDVERGLIRSGEGMEVM